LKGYEEIKEEVEEQKAQLDELSSQDSQPGATFEEVKA